MKQLFLVASLILVGYILIPHHVPAPLAAQLTDEDDVCGTGELSACDDFQKTRIWDPIVVWASMLKSDYMMNRGYYAILEKVGIDAEQLEAEYGDVERGLIALGGCDGQAPGFILAVLRPGDMERDYWCSRIVARFERVRAD